MVKKTNTKKKTQQKLRPTKRNVRSVPRPVRGRSLKETIARHLGSDVTSYLDYLDGKPVSISQLKPPVGAARMMSRWTTTQRAVMTTATGGGGDHNAVLLTNPYYADQNCIVRTSANNNCIYNATCWGSALHPLTELKPSCLAGLTELSHPVYASTGSNAYDSVLGNVTGERRIVGIELTVTPLGTNLNAGGELYVAHDPGMRALAGSAVTGILANPLTIRRGLGQNKTIKFQFGFIQTGSEFQHLKAFANSDNDPAELDHADFEVFGRGEHFTSTSTTYGPDATRGWDFAIVIVSAADAQPYEIFLRYHYEGIRNIPGQATSYVTTPLEMAHANPLGLAVIESAMHGHAHARSNSTEPASIWPHVLEAAKHVLPHIFEAAAGAMIAA